MVDEEFFRLAQVAAGVAGEPIRPEWVYCQWCHESAGFTSALAAANHNLSGLCQTEPNDTPQPDGDQYYMNFPTFEDFASYFGKYLGYYREDGIYDARTVDDYVTALKHGGYFGDSLENYLASVKRFMEEYFPGID